MVNCLLCFGVGLSTFLLNKIIIENWLMFLKKNLDWKENLPAVWMGWCPAAVFNGVVFEDHPGSWEQIHSGTFVEYGATALLSLGSSINPARKGKQSKAKEKHWMCYCDWLRGPLLLSRVQWRGHKTGLPNNLYMPTILQNTGGSLRILEEQRQTH